MKELYKKVAERLSDVFGRRVTSTAALRWLAFLRDERVDRERAARLLYASEARAHVSHMLVGITTTVLLLLVAVTSYPFAGNEALRTCVWASMLVTITTTTWVMLRLNRNEVLSLATGTTAGEVSWDGAFIASFILHVGLPIATLIAGYSPTVGGWLWSLLRPLVEALNR
jgi:hypothetical protein